MSAVNLLCGAVAGVTSKIAVLPFDLVKKRLQVSVCVIEVVMSGVTPFISTGTRI